MSALKLDLEPWGGARLEDCCKDAVRIANILSIEVGFDFNGVYVLAKEGADSHALAQETLRVMDSKWEYKMAVIHPEDQP